MSPNAIAHPNVNVVFPSSGTWDFDPGHTTIAFEGRHLMVTNVRGRFLRFAGVMVTTNDPNDAVVDVVIESESLESGNPTRDEHLRSADFFDVERFPTIAFHASSPVHVAGNRWGATGDLTICGVTRSVEFDVDYGGEIDDPWGNHKLGLSATAVVNRENWGLTWNLALEAGGLVVSKQIRLTIEVEAVRRAR